ncbi:MAG: S-methyl thiohydantoin desulfurase domain-containing protein [Leucobacter sp.]
MTENQGVSHTSRLRSADVARLARGARPFASGVNSAALQVLRDWAESEIEAADVELPSVFELDDEALYAVVTLVGSPTALAEGLPDGTEPARAVAALERAVGKSVRGVLPINTAGENAVLALAAAAALGVDLVDADACGRVRPTVQDTLLTLAGVPIAPCAIASPLGETTLVDGTTARVAQIVPRLVGASGGWAFFAGYALTGREVRAHANPGTISRYLEAEPGNELAGVPHRTLLRATITNIESVDGVALRTSILMTELVADGVGRRVRVDADESYLGALADGVPLQSAAHELFVISESGEVLDPERCLPGMRVALVAVELPGAWEAASTHTTGRERDVI